MLTVMSLHAGVKRAFLDDLSLPSQSTIRHMQ